jgi:hypothetical protein
LPVMICSQARSCQLLNERKKAEMRFAHLKTHHGFERMRLRGSVSAVVALVIQAWLTISAVGPDHNTPGGRPDIPLGGAPQSRQADIESLALLANVLNRLGYFEHVASVLGRLMLDHAVDDHPLDVLNLVRHRNLEVVRQNVGHEANVSGWIIAPHLLKRFTAVLQPA